MKKNILFVLTCIVIPNAFAQSIKSGINVENPGSTLSVGGSFGAAYREVTGSTTLTDQDYYVTYNGTSLNATITLPAISNVTNQKFTGRGYKIKNMSGEKITLKCSSGNTIRYGKSKDVATLSLSSGASAELVCTNNDTNWDLLFFSEASYSGAITMGDFKLPSMYYNENEMSLKNYETGNNWRCINAGVSRSGIVHSGYGNDEVGKYTWIMYEYQGPSFDINRMSVFANVLNSSMGLTTECKIRLNDKGNVVLEIRAVRTSRYGLDATSDVRVVFINAN